MSYASTVLADSPIGYWRLDEASGNFADSSGNGYTGTVTGSPTYSQPGAASIPDNSVTLPGGAYGTVSSPALLNSVTTLTVEAWCKTTTATGTHGIMGSTAATLQQFQFRFNAGKPEVLFFSSGNSAHTLDGPSSLADGAWHHVVATIAGGVITIYVDGASVASASGVTEQSATGLTVLLGSVFSSSFTWIGSLDELAVYGTALSAARVAAHYNAGIAITDTASATLNAVATLSASRVATRKRSDSLNATATLSASRVRGQRRSTVLNAAATLSSRGSTAKLAATHLAATAALASARVRGKVAAATLAAVATLTPATVRTRQRTVQLDAATTLSSTAPSGKTASAALAAVATLLSAPARPIVAPVAGPFEWGFQMLAPGSALIPVEAGLDFIEFGFVMLQPGDALIGDPA